MKIYSLGENKPFRLTKENGYKLALAITSTGARVIVSGIDTTCPPLHIYMRLELTTENAIKFEGIIGQALELPEEASGQ